VITRVLLRNWRGYEKLSLDFGPGLTFVIADNGVGKTSLVNGVAWAVFGDDAGVDADAAIRTGTDETSAEVELLVGDATVALTRTRLRSAPRGRSREAVRVEVDGEPADAHALRSLLGDVAGVPLDIVPQLMFVPEMRLTHEGELFADVQEHLAALLGIDDLRRAARTLRGAQAEANRELRSLQQVARVDEATLAAQAAALAQARDELARLGDELAATDGPRADLEAAARAHRDWAAHDERRARHDARLAELAGELRAAGLEPDPDEVAGAAGRAGEELQHLDADLVAARTEARVVEGLVDQLHGAEADATCPVCRQAVDPATADHAAREHRARLAELADREAETERRRRRVEAAAAKLRTIADELARQRPPEPPESPRPDRAEADVQAELAALDRRRADLQQRRGALGERLTVAEQALEEARRTAETDAALVRAHAVVASSSALAGLAEAEADARTERALEPISRAIADRWAEFFVASATRPRLAGGGSIELGEGRGAGAIPYASFSGGEKTLASLLTRLLFVTAATGLRSMWLDEPLEHLDPANRTRVARLLSQVTRPGSHLRQMVVTTYEEGLARSMVGRHDGTDVVYVSTDALL
jgi:DNA repair exonuclease SbcCD ATPase subunit